MKIGLTHTGNPVKHGFYLQWLTANKDVEIIEFSADKENTAELNECDGLVISGGVDIHPRFYGSDRIDYPGAPEEFNEKRDEMEMALFRAAQEKEIPVLGICRAMQLINVIQQGTLIQHLADDPQHAGHAGNPDKSHAVTIEPGTILFDIVGSEKSKTNSAHRQAVDKLGEGLMVNSRSEEGIVEGIEWADKSGKPFLLAVQWHPERMFRFQLDHLPTSRALRERFFEEIKKSMTRKR